MSVKFSYRVKFIFRQISSNFKIIVTCYLLQVHVLSS